MIFKLKYLLSVFILFIAAVVATAQKQPDDQRIAAEYFRNREYDKALVIYEKLYTESKSQVNYFYYFQCLIELRDFKKAEKVVKEQIRANRNALRYEVDLGFVYINSGDLNKGKKQYEEVIKSLTPTRSVIIDVANAFLVRRENDYAIRTYEKGKILLGDSYQFHLELGDLYERNGNFEGTVKEYLSMVAFDASTAVTVQTRFQNALIKDTDGSKSDILRTALLRSIRQSPDVLVFSELMLWFSIQKEDFGSALNQAIALDRRLDENGSRVFTLAQLSAANRHFDVAVKAYQYLIDKGQDGLYYLQGRVEILNVDYLRITSKQPYSDSELRVLESRYKETLNDIGKSKLTLSLIRNLAHLQAFMLHETDHAIALLNDALSMPGINARDQAECKLELADILLFTGEVWDATLFYSQIEKVFPNEPIGHEAKFRNARLSFFIGEFAWARAQLDVLKAATSKLIANDAMALSLLIKDNMDPDSSYTTLAYFARAELNSYRNRNDLALLTLDSIQTLFAFHPIMDDVLMKKAEINMSTSKFTDAVTLLRQIIEKYPDDLLADKALFRLAELHENNLNDYEKAMEYYKEILLRYPGSLYANPARQRFRNLRGDVI